MDGFARLCGPTLGSEGKKQWSVCYYLNLMWLALLGKKTLGRVCIFTKEELKTMKGFRTNLFKICHFGLWTLLN